MTVTYTGSVGTASLKAFILALFKWRGSVWKAVWVELLVWCLAYAILSICYRLAMNKEQQDKFEDVCALCYKYSELIPLTFLLGFYVTQVVSRWQTMFGNLGWCDNYSLNVAAYFGGKDERTRMMKRSIARYMSLLQVLVYRDISVRIRKRFPTLESLVTAGFLTDNEKTTLDSSTGPHSRYYLPVMWSMKIIRAARDEGRLLSDFAVSDLYRNLLEYWNKEFTLVLFDWVPLPLVYTQVAYVTVRVYFLIALLGRQYIISDRYDALRGPLDAYVPIFTMAQFVFYVGWLRVAEALLNPFGEDDDDFECNWIIDRNFGTAMKIVDSTEGGEGEARVVKDYFWDVSSPTPMYSSLFVPEKKPEPQGSAVAEVKVPKEVIMVPRIEVPREGNSRRTSISMAISNTFSRFRSVSNLNSSNTQNDVEATGRVTPLSSNRPARDQRSISECEPRNGK
ncbi:hypothetical protein PRIPAC_72856 [Pristionchus pacificus]|nr:hypothetical protein PRIPAC_72856 [Pristionchus pacificus]